MQSRIYAKKNFYFKASVGKRKLGRRVLRTKYLV